VERTRTHRTGRLAASFVAIGVLLAGMAAFRAEAAIPPSSFEGGDGNEAVDGEAGAKDWQSLAPSAVTTVTDTPSGQDDDSLQGQENDEEVKVTDGSIQGGQSDLLTSRLSTEIVDGHVFLYWAWTRVSVPNQAGIEIDLELNQILHNAPAVDEDWELQRQLGDLLILFDLPANSTDPELSLLHWLPEDVVDNENAETACFAPGNSEQHACWGGRVVLDTESSPTGEIAVNPTSGGDGFVATGVGDIGGPADGDDEVVFGEAAIDLTAVGAATVSADGFVASSDGFSASGAFLGTQACTSFASAYVKSRTTGGGFNSQISDFLRPVPFALSNCAPIVVTKQAVGGNGTFTFDVDCTGTAFDVTGMTVTTAGGSGTNSTGGIPIGTSCTITERAEPGWTPTAGTTRTVTVGAGQPAAFENASDAGTLTVSKTTVGGTGTFTFDVDCDVNAFDQALQITDSGSGGSSTITGIPSGTTCVVTERANAVFSSVSDPADGRVTLGATGQTVAFTNQRLSAAVAIDKSPSVTEAVAGQTMTYTFLVTNPGQLPLSSVVVTDNRCSPVTFADGDTNGNSTLEVGETWRYTCTQVQTGDASTLTNVGTVNAVDPAGAAVTASDTVTIGLVAGVVLEREAQVLGVSLARTGMTLRLLTLALTVLLLGVVLVFGARRFRRGAATSDPR